MCKASLYQVVYSSLHSLKCGGILMWYNVLCDPGIVYEVQGLYALLP